MFTPHDWRNGADYSDETYESFHNTFETYDTFGKFLKIFFIVIACADLRDIFNPGSGFAGDQA